MRKTGAWRSRMQALAPLAGLLMMVVFFCAAVTIQDWRQQDPTARSWREAFDAGLRFVGARNMETLARQSAIVGTAALGMTLIIAMGGIDLSVGSVVALSTVVMAWLLQRGCSPWAAAGGGVLLGAACGLFNGLLIIGLRVAPFIVTLGTLLIARGAAKGLAQEQKIDVNPDALGWLGDLLSTLGREDRWMLVPPGVWALIALAALTAVLLRYTRLGRHIFAIGSSELAARLCGVPVPRVKVTIYVLGAVFAGLAGVMQFSRLTVGDPTVAVGLELDVIAAVVIGGGSLAGGEGSVQGTIIGALIMIVIRSGCSHMGLPNWVQEIITGLIIVTAVTLDRLRHRRAQEG